MNDEQLENIKKRVAHQVMHKTLLKYKILRIRAKISYEAFISRQTISEMFMTRILDTFNLFEENKIIQGDNIKRTTEIAIQRLMMGDMTNTFQTVLEFNADKYNLDFKALNEKIEKD